jgi:hypothetical protein
VQLAELQILFSVEPRQVAIAPTHWFSLAGNRKVQRRSPRFREQPASGVRISSAERRKLTRCTPITTSVQRWRGNQSSGSKSAKTNLFFCIWQFGGRKPGDHTFSGPPAVSFVGSVNSDIENGKIKKMPPPLSCTIWNWM